MHVFDHFTHTSNKFRCGFHRFVRLLFTHLFSYMCHSTYLCYDQLFRAHTHTTIILHFIHIVSRCNLIVVAFALLPLFPCIVSFFVFVFFGPPRNKQNTRKKKIKKNNLHKHTEIQKPTTVSNTMKTIVLRLPTTTIVVVATIKRQNIGYIPLKIVDKY